MSKTHHKRIILLIIALIVLILATPAKASAPQPVYVKPLTPKEAIVKQAMHYATPAEPIIAVATCESTLNPKAHNKKDPNGGSYGYMQFQSATFYSYAKKLEIQNPDIWNIDQQAQVAAYMFKNGQARQWSCARILKIVK